MMLLSRLLALMLLLVGATEAPASAASASDLSGDFVTTKNAPTARLLGDKLHDVPSVLDYGAICDAVGIQLHDSIVQILAGTP